MENQAFALVLAISCASLVATVSAQAANQAWSTAPTDGTFGGINWNTGLTVPTAPPANAAAGGDALVFGTSSIVGLKNDLTGAAFTGLTFNVGALAFTIGGNSFTLSGNIANNSSVTQTINAPIALDAARQVTGNGSTVLGGITSGAFNLTKANGTGRLTLSGVNTFTGGLTIAASGGTTVNAVRLTDAKGAGTGTISIDTTGNVNAARLELDGAAAAGNGK